MRLSNNTKVIVKDLSSDVDSYNKFGDDISDCTSLTSNNSIREMVDIPRITDKKSPIVPTKNPANLVYDPKKMYQDFVKICLKVKFEKLHNSHSGRDIPEKILFKECLKKEIPESEWYSFVLNELQSTHKYTQYIKNNAKLN